MALWGAMAHRTPQPGIRTAPPLRPVPRDSAATDAWTDSRHGERPGRTPRDVAEPRPPVAYEDDIATTRLERRRATRRRMQYRRRRTAVLSLLLLATVLVTVDLVRDRPRSAAPSLATAGVGPISSAATPTEPPAPSPSAQPTAESALSDPTPAPTPPPPSPTPPPPPPSPTQARPPSDGSGRFGYAATAGPVLGAAGTLRRFHVAVEEGMGITAATFAGAADRILGDERSWIAGGGLRLQRVPPTATAEFTLYLASAGTSERMCAQGGLDTDRYTSCRLPGQVIINADRWFMAIEGYGAPLSVYQDYVINHEVGHQFGQGHEACTGAGKPAPVMQQQTLGLDGCVANSWPYLDGKRYAGPPVP